MGAQSFHSVIIASRGRPLVLKATLESIWKQKVQPDEIIISVVDEFDVSPFITNSKLKVIYAKLGSCPQRNAGIQMLDNRCALVSFLDDDLELGVDYFEQVKSFFIQNHTVVGVNGNILMEGCSREKAQAMLQNVSHSYSDMTPMAIKSLYGCNMHFRREAIGQEIFDERLSLYGWLEDFDFSIRVGQNGNLYCVPQAVLCHLKEPTGRMNNRKFGFAQIMNPFYLSNKNTISFLDFLRRHLIPCTISNFLKLLTFSKIGRDRFSGNIFAFIDIILGRCSPEDVSKL
jgi:glycosyltransferase involved in cell wall biosynthesis